MSFQRRQLLQLLSYAFGSSFILPRIEFAVAAQNSAQPASPTLPAQAAAKHESGGTQMEKVAGIGGGCFSELMIPQRWDAGTCNTWGSRSHQRARAEPFGSKRPDQPRSVPFPKRVAISGILPRSGW